MTPFLAHTSLEADGEAWAEASPVVHLCMHSVVALLKDGFPASEVELQLSKVVPYDEETWHVESSATLRTKAGAAFCVQGTWSVSCSTVSLQSLSFTWNATPGCDAEHIIKLCTRENENVGQDSSFDHDERPGRDLAWELPALDRYSSPPLPPEHEPVAGADDGEQESEEVQNLTGQVQTLKCVIQGLERGWMRERRVLESLASKHLRILKSYCDHDLHFQHLVIEYDQLSGWCSEMANQKTISDAAFRQERSQLYYQISDLHDRLAMHEQVPEDGLR